MLLLVVVLGFGLTLVSCKIEPVDTPTPPGTPPNTPPSQPSPQPSTPDTPTPGPSPTSPSTPAPSPTSSPTLPPPICPTPSDTPTPTDTPSPLSLDEIRINHEDIRNTGNSVEQYLRQEEPALILTRIAMAEATGRDDRTFVMWIVRKRVEMFGISVNDVILQEGQFEPMIKMKRDDATNNPFNPAYAATTQDEQLRAAILNNESFDNFDVCNLYTDMLHVCSNENRIQQFREIYAEAKTIVNAPVSSVPDDLKGFDGFGAPEIVPIDKVYESGGGKPSDQLAGGNVYRDVSKIDNEGGY